MATLESYWLENCINYDSWFVIYGCKMFSRIATGLLVYFRSYQAQILLIKNVYLNSIQSWILGIESK